MADQKKPSRTEQRPTEPLPTSLRPAWMLMLCLFAVVCAIALAAYLVDRSIYGF